MFKIVTAMVALLGFAANVAHAEVLTAPPPAAVTPASPSSSLLASDAERLNQRGLRLRRAGAVLMGVGGGVLLAGTALTVAGYVGNNDAVTRIALIGSGIAAGALGAVTLLVGVPTFFVGKHKVDRAARWRMTALGAAPLVANGGGGAIASTSFAF
jgi:hypothetical protein